MPDSADHMNKAMDLAMKVTAVIMAGVALYEAVNALSAQKPQQLGGSKIKPNHDAEALDPWDFPTAEGRA